MDFAAFCLTVLRTKQLSEVRYSFLLNETNVHTGYLDILRIIFVKSEIQEFEIIQLQAEASDTLHGKLSMTFLGQRKIYLIYGLSILTPKEQKKYLDLLNAIQSEHIIFLITTKKEQNYGTKIVIKPTLTRQETLTLLTLITGNGQQFFAYFLDTLENKGVTINYEEFNLILSYSGLVGHKSPDFFTNWIPRIFSSQKSLFQLSQAFFAKDSALFLHLWKTMYDQYSIAFWSVFFSEQLFKAALFVSAKKSKKMVDPEIESRMPFSFLKKDWQLHDANMLIDLHQAVCNFDITFKSGEVREEQLELLCIQYIEKKH